MALEDWRSVRTRNFEILTDAAPLRAGEIALGLERFRAVFAQLAPELDLNSPVPIHIFAFRDRESYAPYKSVPDRGRARILGQFLASRDGNYITLDAGSRLIDAYSVIYHEYVHYFMRNNFPAVPLWLHEGLAEYYSTVATEGDRVVVGLPVRRHLDWLRRAVELGVDEVLAAASGGGHGAGASAGRFYAVSWLLVHYLMSGGEERMGQVAELLIQLGEGESSADAFAEVFRLDASELERQLQNHLAGALPSASIPIERLAAGDAFEAVRLPPAEVLYELGELSLQLNRPEEAARHFADALAHDPQHADAHAGLAAVRDLESRFAEARILYQDALGIGSARAITHLRHGRHLMAMMEAPDGREERPQLAAAARDAFATAVSLDPDFVEARAMLGLVHLHPGLEASAGVPHLERASARLPSRLDLVFHLVQLHLRAGEHDRAERLTEGRLARRAEPELLWRAREEIERARLVHAADEALRRGDLRAGASLLDRAISATSDPQIREQLEAQLTALNHRAGFR